jgi:uncharacterized protein YjgD (DUF1641 family)
MDGANSNTDLEHLFKAANDALTDDMVTRMAQTAADGMDLVDQVNRSGLKRAIPAIAELVNNGDLDRLVRVARVFGAAEDALTDDMINRMAATIGEGLSMLDKLNRSGVGRLIAMLERMEASGSLEKMTETLPQLCDRLGQLESLLAALDRAGETSSSQVAETGGVMSLLKLLGDRQNQDALRHLLNVGRALKSG